MEGFGRILSKQPNSMVWWNQPDKFVLTEPQVWDSRDALRLWLDPIVLILSLFALSWTTTFKQSISYYWCYSLHSQWNIPPHKSHWNYTLMTSKHTHINITREVCELVMWLQLWIWEVSGKKVGMSPTVEVQEILTLAQEKSPESEVSYRIEVACPSHLPRLARWDVCNTSGAVIVECTVIDI